MLVEELDGVRLVVSGDAVLVANRKRKHGFEPHARALWRMLASRGKVMVDVGAYTGFYSILGAVAGASNVYAFEPNPAAVKRLVHNLVINRCENVDVVPRALGSVNGVDYLRGRGPLTSAASFAGVEPVLAQVVTRRLDEEGLGRVYAIKIDVERAEADVIRGALETLREYRPHLLIECLRGTQEIDSLLHPLGYRGRTLDRGMYYYRARS